MSLGWPGITRVDSYFTKTKNKSERQQKHFVFGVQIFITVVRTQRHLTVSQKDAISGKNVFPPNFACSGDRLWVSH